MWVYLDDPNPPSPDKRHLIAFNSEAKGGCLHLLQLCEV